MKLIVAADSNWAIGNRGELLVRIPKYRKVFQNETMGKVVVMGHKTLEKLPQGQPHAGCINIVLSKDENLRVKGAKVLHSGPELLEEIKKYNSEDVYITGGESIYKELIRYCDTAHVTKIDHVYEADAYFPDLDKDPGWELTEESDEETYFDLEYRFLKYERKK